MKVTVIEPSGRLYGSEFCLLEIIDGLPSFRFDWRVVMPQGAGFDKHLLDRDIECEFLIPKNFGDLSKWQRLFIYLKILMFLRRIKTQLLYVNQAGSLRSAAFYASWLKLPMVCQVQTLEDARWVSKHSNLHKFVNAFICNTQFIANQTRCDSGKKCVLHYGIPPQKLERAKLNKSKHGNRPINQGEKDTFTIGLLGRIAVSKGHYVFAKAAKELCVLVPGCKFVIIGEGLTSEDTNEFEATIKDSGLSDKFEFRGYRTDVDLELSRLDLLVIPSIAEPLGRVLFDAAEFGVPVVLSDGGGLGEIGKRFDIGVRFESGNSDALAEAIFNVSKNYKDTHEQFLRSSVSMFERLAMGSYLSVIERILVASAKFNDISEVWLGDEKSR